MIEYVFGARGSGKTKQMIDMANMELDSTQGDVLFINDREKYRVEVNNRIRFINTDEYDILGEKELYGFLCGLLASNYDISAIFLDNFLRIIDADGAASTEGFINQLKALPSLKDVKLVLSISSDRELAPDFMK